MRQVCFLLNNEFVTDNRVRREAESLVRAGYKVHLFAVENKDKTISLPVKETSNGVFIHRIFKKRLPNFSPFSINHVRSFIKIISCYRHFDIVHAHDVNTLLLGWALARFWKARLIYDSHELWSSMFEDERARLLNEQSLKKKEKKPFARSLRHLKHMESLEKWLLKRCDAVISVNQSLCNLLKSKISSKDLQCVPIRNISPYLNISATEKHRRFHEAFNLEPDVKVIVYQGGITAVRGIGQLLDMMEYLEGEKIVLGLIGPAHPDYLNGLIERINKSGWLKQAVFYKPPVKDSEELLKWTASADIGIHPILNCRLNHYYCLPNKLFEYIQAQIPVAVSDLPEMKLIVDQYDVGFTFDSAHPEEMAVRMRDYFANPSLEKRYLQNIPKAKMDLSWEKEQNHLINLYASLLGESITKQDKPEATSHQKIPAAF